MLGGRKGWWMKQDKREGGKEGPLPPPTLPTLLLKTIITIIIITMVIIIIITITIITNNNNNRTRCTRTSSKGRQGYVITHAFTTAPHSLLSSIVTFPCPKNIHLSISALFTPPIWDPIIFFTDQPSSIADFFHVQSPGIPTRLSLTVTLISGRVYQTLPNQNTESGNICYLLFHGICHWFTSSDPSFILILK